MNGEGDESDLQDAQLRVTPDRLTPEQAHGVLEALVSALSRTQRDRDELARIVAAGAVAVTASVIAVLEEAGWSGGLAVGLSLLSLAAVLASFWTSEKDTLERIERAKALEGSSADKGPLTATTKRLNAAACVLLVGAGVALVVFLVTHTNGGQ